MLTTSTHRPLAQPDAQLSLAAVEMQLASLGDALRARDSRAIEAHGHALHVALMHAVEDFARAARSGPLPPELRARLVKASGTVALQRQTLARATAALARAMNVLMPRDPARPYSPAGAADRRIRHGVIQA